MFVSVFAVVSFYYSQKIKTILPKQKTVLSKPAEQTETSKLPVSPKVVAPIIKPNVTEPEMVEIPTGSFTMGCKKGRDDVEGNCLDSEKPAHQVTLKAFLMSKFEVTVGQYLECVDAGECAKPEWQEKGSNYNIETGSNNRYKEMGNALTNKNYPIVGVSWNNAQTYAKWLTRQTGKACRLPSEAEWEYAARGGDNKKAFPWGNKASYEFMNSRGIEGKNQWAYTSPVGSFKENDYGLHDMHGNVKEWVEDKWHSNYQGAPADGSAWLAGDSTRRVLRGGSWGGTSFFVRSAIRDSYSPGGRDFTVGFRIVCAPIH